MSKIKSLYMYDRIADITPFWGTMTFLENWILSKKVVYYNYDN